MDPMQKKKKAQLLEAKHFYVFRFISCILLDKR